jgi:hypothetical protein
MRRVSREPRIQRVEPPSQRAGIPDPGFDLVPPDAPAPLWAIDMAVGACALALDAATAVTRRARPWLEPVTSACLRDISRLLDSLVPVVVEQLLRRLDLTDTVVRHVDLTEVVAAVDLEALASRLDVNAVVRQLDLDALIHAVLERLDLPRLAEEVIDAVDLPEIIRESTGSMASDTIRGVRMQGIAADEAVRRGRGRLFPRRGRESTGTPDPDLPQAPAGQAETATAEPP